MDHDMQVRNAVILASGSGRRMQQKERFPSKPMTMVDKKPLISYGIDVLINGGIKKIYIVYHSVTADVLKVLDYSDNYAEYLEFIEEDVRKGTLLTFSRVRDFLVPPFIMIFGDIIVDKSDFVNMLHAGKKYIVSDADLVIQTVCTPSILSEKAFLAENGRIIRYRKNGIVDETKYGERKKYGGMVYLWLSDPFRIIDNYLLNQNYRFSSFLEDYISDHIVYEMSVNDMWDVDTPEVLRRTEELIKKRGGLDGSIQ
ncbi:MAG: NTP transferase domain-containing protein [Dorea sp.]|uniref:sugar phosphate nucleotidyltransferase n=1 Tax=Sporofaciens musculi TaxID=2681861 RepID=UPI00216F9633|nr:sugar phosphate nucleotidyltransferase [Sporofaciens musculi]MCI9423496.1 NTP transferase domain-containing protein [Dorea sp.]